MGCLLQISDTHFGTEQPAVVAALEELARTLAPAVVVLSGDITQRATARQFAAARAFVDRLRAPAVVALPGNHDIPLFQLGARLLSPYGRYRKAFGDALEPMADLPGWRVVGVNTTRWWRHKHGVVSAAQAERIAARLAGAAPAQLRVVVTHQPIAVVRPQDTRHALRGGEAAARRWAAAGADLVLGGHIHLPYVRPLHEGFVESARPLWAVQAGTAVSTRVREGHPNSVNVLRPEAVEGAPRGCCVERWDYAPGERAFVRAVLRRLPLGLA